RGEPAQGGQAAVLALLAGAVPAGRRVGLLERRDQRRVALRGGDELVGRQVRQRGQEVVPHLGVPGVVVALAGEQDPGAGLGHRARPPADDLEQPRLDPGVAADAAAALLDGLGDVGHGRPRGLGGGSGRRRHTPVPARRPSSVSSARSASAGGSPTRLGCRPARRAPARLLSTSSRNTARSGATPPSRSSVWVKIAGSGLRMPTAELSTTTSNRSSTGSLARQVDAPSRTLLVTSAVR